MLRHSLDRHPSRSFPVPSHYGALRVHHNDVLRIRAAAVRLWRKLQRAPLSATIPRIPSGAFALRVWGEDTTE